MTYFVFYVVLVADDHNFFSLFYWTGNEQMLNVKKELIDNMKIIVFIDSAMFVYKN